jgi:hypothetical protein
VPSSAPPGDPDRAGSLVELPVLPTPQRDLVNRTFLLGTNRTFSFCGDIASYLHCQAQIEMSCSLPSRNVRFAGSDPGSGVKFGIDVSGESRPLGQIRRPLRRGWLRSRRRQTLGRWVQSGTLPRVLVFQQTAALVKLWSSGLRINQARRSPGRFCPALLIEG